LLLLLLLLLERLQLLPLLLPASRPRVLVDGTPARRLAAGRRLRRRRRRLVTAGCPCLASGGAAGALLTCRR
jgi:hypothetical protein